MPQTNAKPSVSISIKIILITFVVFFVSRNPVTEPFSTQLTLILLVALVAYGFLAKSKSGSITTDTNFAYLLIAFVISFIALTGWFFSPFFFLLYLLGLFLCFVIGPVVCTAFMLTLVALFSLNIGSVNLIYDMLFVVSLITVIPIGIYLRNKYLFLLEAEKEILVLEKEKNEKINEIEKVLANRINNFAVNIRQPINDTKQLTYQLDKLTDKAKIARNKKRIIRSGNEALKMLKEFEEETTGKLIHSTPYQV